jgi:CcmD family protein
VGLAVGYLFAAYAVIWTALFLYITGLRGRQARLQREVERLREAMGQPSEPGS